jgi:hypothetical protein
VNLLASQLTETEAQESFLPFAKFAKISQIFFFFTQNNLSQIVDAKIYEL